MWFITPPTDFFFANNISFPRWVEWGLLPTVLLVRKKCCTRIKRDKLKRTICRIKYYTVVQIKIASFTLSFCCVAPFFTFFFLLLILNKTTPKFYYYYYHHHRLHIFISPPSLYLLFFFVFFFLFFFFNKSHAQRKFPPFSIYHKCLTEGKGDLLYCKNEKKSREWV